MTKLTDENLYAINNALSALASEFGVEGLDLNDLTHLSNLRGHYHHRIDFATDVPA